MGRGKEGVGIEEESEGRGVGLEEGSGGRGRQWV